MNEIGEEESNVSELECGGANTEMQWGKSGSKKKTRTKKKVTIVAELEMHKERLVAALMFMVRRRVSLLSMRNHLGQSGM